MVYAHRFRECRVAIALKNLNFKLIKTVFTSLRWMCAKPMMPKFLTTYGAKFPQFFVHV